MKLSYTFQKYILKLFFIWLSVTITGLSFILFIFNTMELIRKSQPLPNVNFSSIVKLSFLQLPGLIDQMTPFAFLFSVMFLMWNLYKRSELVVIRAAGFSIWEIMTPILFGVVAFSALHVGVLDPIIVATQQEKEGLQAKIFGTNKSLACMSSQGLWVRQHLADGYSIIHIKNIVFSPPSLINMTIFEFSEGGSFLKRYDTSMAEIVAGGWQMHNVRLSESNTLLQSLPDQFYPSDLTLAKLQQSFSPPSTLSIWQLPRFIGLIEEAGFSSIEHKLYFYNALTKPFLLMGVCLLGCLSAFSILRRNNNFIFILSSIVLGFGLYFMHHVLFTLGESLRLPLFLAALIPTLVTILLSLALLIHLEEG